jgi:hypothetical protein
LTNGEIQTKRFGRVPEGTGFLNSPSTMMPDATDPVYNFSHAFDSESQRCTILPMPDFQIVSRLEEGDQLIVLDLVVELADSGRCF